MPNSTLLEMPYLEAAQAQKHVTHNEALRILDATVQLSVLDKDLNAPPGGGSDSDRYIIGPSPTGAWSGKAGKIAAYQDGAYRYITPREGWWAWVADEDILLVYSGSAWVDFDVAHKQLGIRGAYGGEFRIKLLEQSTTLSGATTNAATQIPIGTVKACSIYVATTVSYGGGGASWSIGDPGTPGRFGSGLGNSVATTNRGHIGPTGYYSATDLRFTPNAGTFAGGVVHSNLWYEEFTPPTS